VKAKFRFSISKIYIDFYFTIFETNKSCKIYQCVGYILSFLGFSGKIDHLILKLRSETCLSREISSLNILDSLVGLIRERLTAATKVSISCRSAAKFAYIGPFVPSSE